MGTSSAAEFLKSNDGGRAQTRGQINSFSSMSHKNSLAFRQSFGSKLDFLQKTRGSFEHMSHSPVDRVGKKTQNISVLENKNKEQKDNDIVKQDVFSTGDREEDNEYGSTEVHIHQKKLLNLAWSQMGTRNEMSRTNYGA